MIILFLIFSFSGCDNFTFNEISDSDQTDDYFDYNDATIKRNTLKVGYTSFSYNFNPFTVENNADIAVMEMTSVRLLTLDRDGRVLRNAINGEGSEYNGESFKYRGVADITVIELENEETEIVFKLRDGLKCSDGSFITVDDVIFSMYVLADPSYEGAHEFSKLPIVGIEDFENNTSEKISGINRIDDNTLSVRLQYFEENMLSMFNIYIAPIKYYGDAAKYDYENNSFGFVKGEIGHITNKLVPFGAGPYYFVSQDENSIQLKRNQCYYKGIPNIECVEFESVDSTEMLSRVADGSLDIIELPMTDGLYNQILDINGAEDGVIFKTSFIDSVAIVFNAQAIDVNSYSGTYSKYFLWVNDIYVMEMNSGF